MYEYVHNAMIWLMSGVLDRQPKLGESLRLMLLLWLTVFVTYIYLRRWRFLYRLSTLRRWFLPNEKYAGRYLLAIFDGAHIEYAIIQIFYIARKGQYQLVGRVYDAQGKGTSLFKSDYIVFPVKKEDNIIDFIWKKTTGPLENAIGGFTRMILQIAEDGYIQGSGWIYELASEHLPRQIRFKHLLDRHVHTALGMNGPKRIKDESEFIQKFHSTYGTQVREGFSHMWAPVTEAVNTEIAHAPDLSKA